MSKNLERMLAHLGFPHPDTIVTKLGDERIIALTLQMLEGIDPGLVKIWSMTYGIGCGAHTATRIVEAVGPPLTRQSITIKKKRVRKLLLHHSRIHILTREVQNTSSQ